MLDRLECHDLTDAEWERLRVFLPADPRQGGRWRDHRTVINGVFFRARAGCPWRDLPEGFGNWKTVYNRHRRWSLDGSWEKVLDGLHAGCDEGEGKDWTVSTDSTVVRAHQHAAGACRTLPADLARGAAANEQEPARGRGRPGGPGPVPRRAEHHDPPGCGPALPAPHPDPHPRPAW